MHHGPSQPLFHMAGQRTGVGEARAVHGAADEAQFLLAKAPARTRLGDQAQMQAELGVVAQFRMRVERQVVGEQVDVVAEQQPETLSHPADHTAVLPAPEQAVVHEDRVGLGADGGLDQRAAGGHARHDLADLRAAFHLETVRAIVLEAVGCQQQVERVQQFVAGRAHPRIVAQPLPGA